MKATPVGGGSYRGDGYLMLAAAIVRQAAYDAVGKVDGVHKSMKPAVTAEAAAWLAEQEISQRLWHGIAKTRLDVGYSGPENMERIGRVVTKKQCKGYKATGERCRRSVFDGDYCSQHDPALIAHRRLELLNEMSEQIDKFTEDLGRLKTEMHQAAAKLRTAAGR